MPGLTARVGGGDSSFLWDSDFRKSCIHTSLHIKSIENGYIHVDDILLNQYEYHPHSFLLFSAFNTPLYKLVVDD